MLKYFVLLLMKYRNTWLYLQKIHFTIAKQGPVTIDEGKFRLDTFVMFVEEWLRRKLRLKLVIQCLR